MLKFGCLLGLLGVNDDDGSSTHVIRICIFCCLVDLAFLAGGWQKGNDEFSAF